MGQNLIFHGLVSDVIIVFIEHLLRSALAGTQSIQHKLRIIHPHCGWSVHSIKNPMLKIDKTRPGMIKRLSKLQSLALIRQNYFPLRKVTNKLEKSG